MERFDGGEARDKAREMGDHTCKTLQGPTVQKDSWGDRTCNLSTSEMEAEGPETKVIFAYKNEFGTTLSTLWQKIKRGVKERMQEEG